MAWVILLFAGLMEIGWPLGLKYGWREDGIRTWPLLLAVVSMLASGALLFLAQRTIPMGTAYVVWTGIGSVGAFVAGVGLFGGAGTPARGARVGLVFFWGVWRQIFS